MLIFKIIILIINIFLFIYGAHFAIFALLPYLKKPKKIKKFNPVHKFRIIIPARNEELVIGELVESLKDQNYPKDMYEIYVIPNNCTDKTKEVASKAGAQIIDIKSPVQTKGEVLNYVFSKMQKDKSFDTYVIFDADNIAHPNFLKEINNMMENGYEAVQGYRDTKNLYESWLSNSYALSYYLQNIFLYEPRMRLGASANLNGTGYAVSKEIIEKTKYKATTLTEDIELMNLLAINNIKIGYTSKAIFYDEQVEDFIPSLKQRKRWAIGTWQVLKKYFKSLCKSIKDNKNLHALDCIYLGLGPIFQILIGFSTICNFFFIKNYWIFLASGILSYLGTIFLSSFMIKYSKKNIIKSLKGILLFPLFTVSGILAVLMTIFSSNKKWEEIKHTRKINIRNIMENE